MRFLAIMLLTFAIGTVIAPVYAGPQAEVAVKGGPNNSNTTNDSTVDLHSRYGLSGGLTGVLRWPFVDRYSVAGQMEFLYAPRGTRVSFEGEELGKLRYHYVDVTLAARPEVRLGPARIYLLLGAGLNLLMSASLEVPSGAKSDATDDLHRVDVALIAGAGVALHLSRREVGPFRFSSVFLEARHDHGLLDTDAVNGGFKNRASSLMLGVSLALSSGETSE